MKKILLVEDDAFFAGRLKELLIDHGHSVVLASSTEEALKIPADSFDWAIIDVMLPNDENVTGISDMESRGGYLSGIALARRLQGAHKDKSYILLSGGAFDAEASAWATSQRIPFIPKIIGFSGMQDAFASAGLIERDSRPSSFIVHGHDDLTLLELKDFIQNSLGWRQPIVLRDQPNCGRTIIEKFETLAARIDWVFVLLTPDDQLIAENATDDEKRRARQNVVFEMGYFYGKLDRLKGRVVALVKGPIDLPSDISGILWISIEDGVKSAAEAIRNEVGRLHADLGV